MKTAMRKIILLISLIGIVMLTGLLMTACGNHTSDRSEPAMNTIQAYDLSEEQHSLMSIVAPDAENAIIEFATDGTYKSVCAGYDYYEKGVLVSKNCAESEMPFAYDGESEKTYGKICSYINDDDVVINILVGNSAAEETDSLGHKSPLSNEDQTAIDMESYAESSLLEPTDIERNKKMYIRAELRDNDDELETSDVVTLMSDKKMLSSSDKCFAFYVIFK